MWSMFSVNDMGVGWLSCAIVTASCSIGDSSGWIFKDGSVPSAGKNNDSGDLVLVSLEPSEDSKLEGDMSEGGLSRVATPDNGWGRGEYITLSVLIISPCPQSPRNGRRDRVHVCDLGGIFPMYNKSVSKGNNDKHPKKREMKECVVRVWNSPESSGSFETGNPSCDRQSVRQPEATWGCCLLSQADTIPDPPALMRGSTVCC